MKKIFDLHCDLPTKVHLQKVDLIDNHCHWSLEKIPCEQFIQFFACFVDQKATDNPFMYVCNMISAFKEAVKKTSSLRLAESFFDIEKNCSEGKHSAILTIEGGEALNEKIEHLDLFYRNGVRLLTLTWNYENALGYGVGANKDTLPLKPFGLKVISRMEQLSMLIDVSHLNEGGFWSVAEHTKKAFVASHSNARKICSHKRNLTDAQIKCMISRNGLIGLNLYPVFLNDTGKATITDVLKHIEHMLSLGAENNLMLGCDFDGIDTTPQGIDGIDALTMLIDEMQKNNFDNETIAKIFYKNGEKQLKSLLF